MAHALYDESYRQGALRKIYITEPSDDLGIRVRPHFMLNEELKSLDYFLCVSVHDTVYSGPVPPNCPNTRVPGKQV